MDERLLILDKILRNKTAVKRLQTSGVLFCKCQLAVINHYAYKDIYEKIELMNEIKNMPIRDDIEDDNYDVTDEMLEIYDNGLKKLLDDNYYYISNVDNYQILDNKLFENNNYVNDRIFREESLESALAFVDKEGFNLCTIHIIKKSDIMRTLVNDFDKHDRYVLSCGRMEDDKIHIYQIDTLEREYHECRTDYIPYDNNSKLGYYLPFMEKTKYLGTSYNVEPDGCGTWYGFIKCDGYNVDISWLAFNCFGNIATYDFIYEYSEE